MARLEEIGPVVRRVVAARVGDPDLAEDLAQEALARIAGSAGERDGDELRAYAIVVARNLVASHYRREDVRRRHAHLVEDGAGPGDDGEDPEAAVLVREERDAMAAALAGLPDDERQLLVEHDAHGASTHELAASAGSSPGAIAMRLSRARATLRVDYVVAYRRVQLPSRKCRPVLIALAAGDRRRQDALDARRHLRTCAACDELAEAVTARRRGLAATLFAALGGAGGRIQRTVREHPVGSVAAGSAVVVAAVVLGVAVLADDDQEAADPAASSEPATREAAAADVPPTAASTAAPRTTAAPSTTAARSTTAAPTTTAATATPSTVVSGPPAACASDPFAVGCPFGPLVVEALDGIAPEGFWAVADDGTTLWVALRGAGESPVTVTEGDRFVVSGTVVDPATSGADPADPRAAEAAAHVAVDYGAIRPV